MMRVTTTTTMEGIFEGGTIATRRRFRDWRRRQRQMQRVGRDVSYAKLDNTDAAVVSHLVVAVGQGGIASYADCLGQR